MSIFYSFCSWKYQKIPSKVEYFSKFEEIFPFGPDCQNASKTTNPFGKFGQGSIWNPTIFNIICWVEGKIISSTMFQVLLFFIISCKILSKNPFNLFFYNFTKIKSFECPMSNQQHTVLFSIYQNRLSDTWSVRRVTQRIILKIVRFLFYSLFSYWFSSFKLHN